MDRYYDVIGTVTTGGVLALLQAPWPLWAVWAGIVGYVARNHIQAARHA